MPRSIPSGAELVEPYRIRSGKKFKLRDFDPGDTQALNLSKTEARKLLAGRVALLADQQEMLYAGDRWALLVILQGIDAAGKDGVVKHVMSGVNPQGVSVTSFKAPTKTELNHTYLWRAQVAGPARGRITIFNRSYYEEVLVVRVHPQLLDMEQLPEGLVTDRIWEERFEDINAYERYLTRNGVRVVKFFLNLSKEEQKKRFLKRIDDTDRHWKFSAGDITERGYWEAYQAAFQEMIVNTSTVHAPWYVVPADNKWFTRYVVGEALLEELRALHLRYPQLDPAREAELTSAARLLAKE